MSADLSNLSRGGTRAEAEAETAPKTETFSYGIKEQLCAVRELSLREQTAMLYGMFFAGREISGKAAVRTENPSVISAAQYLLPRVYGDEHYETQRLDGGSSADAAPRYSLCVRREIFGDFSGINPKIVSGNDKSSGAFLRGIFVSCGYITDPNKAYHLELVLSDGERAETLSAFLAEHGMPLKTTVRSSQTILYSKSSEQIEDFLTYIGAGNRSLEIMQVKIEKNLRNRANRSVNCDSANLDKTVAASEKSCRDIRLIIGTIGLDALSEELRETARLRLDNPESPLSELCRMFGRPISRSGLNHRLRKLSEIADNIRSNI